MAAPNEIHINYDSQLTRQLSLDYISSFPCTLMVIVLSLRFVQFFCYYVSVRRILRWRIFYVSQSIKSNEEEIINT